MRRAILFVVLLAGMASAGDVDKAEIEALRKEIEALRASQRTKVVKIERHEGPSDPTGLVVHEWGVMIRSATTAGNVLAAPEELLYELPAFVLRHERAYIPEPVRVWLKPVIHFYGPEGLDVSVNIRTAKGRPSVYWPKPDKVESTELTWSGRLSATPAEKCADAPAAHWWSRARGIPGLHLNTKTGSERFIFYEGTALQEPTVKAGVTSAFIQLHNHDAVESGPVLVIVFDGQALRWRLVPSLKRQETVRIMKSELKSELAGFSSSGEDLLQACRRQWETFGMTPAEAAAIVEIWKEDLLRRHGFLVVSRIPAAAYEAMFPLRIQPKPDQVVRVGLVFDTLPGESARLDWLPGLAPELEAWGRDLGHQEFAVRRKAYVNLARLGDLARPFLETLLKSKDAEVNEAARGLLERMKPREPAAEWIHGGPPRF